MIVELYLSQVKCGFPVGEMQVFSSWLTSVYGKFRINKEDYEYLFELMGHDKKNEGKRINFTLITSVGKFEINQNCSKQEIFDALDFFRELNNA